MTTINRMIAEATVLRCTLVYTCLLAKSGAVELRLPARRVRGVAEHCRTMPENVEGWSIDEIADKMRRGEMKLLGVPVRVIGDG